MTDIIASNRHTAILGMGATGLSVARYLSARGESFAFVDSRDNPPNLGEVQALYPKARVACGAFDADLLCAFSRLVVSPGIDLRQPALIAAAQAGVEITGDAELFFAEACAGQNAVPVIAITGSNGKSTVTTLVGEMAKAAGLRVAVGGNLGTPMLDLLSADCQLYVVELSSFQLELLNDSRGAISTVLNLSPDHMDRYADLQAYHAAKQRIYRNASAVICNREDALTRALPREGVVVLSFGLNRPDFKGFGLIDEQGESWLAHEFTPLLPLHEVALKGRHNIANALAALALGYAAGLDMAPMLETLRSFRGLSHRCELVADNAGTLYIDDSKGTNVGATLAALNGFGDAGYKHLLLIAGGQGKGQDFSELRPPVQQFVKLLVLIGEDAGKIEAALAGAAPIKRASSMLEAVQLARAEAASGDVVLLSPACASFDMFSGYVERGQSFQRAVREVAV